MSTARPGSCPEVLWWGRSDVGYSRNGILRRAFEALGWRVTDFRPLAGPVAHVHAGLRAPRTPTLIWVPAFRQRDVPSARRHADRIGVPLCFDPLISAYDKQVWERRKVAPGGLAARRLLAWERRRFAAADAIVADTAAHAGYFAAELGVAPQRLHVVPVGADESLFTPAPLPPLADGVEVLFFGSFLPLQGPEIIVQAARAIAGPQRRVTLLGAGELRDRCRALAADAPHIRFEPWIGYRELPQRIRRAHLLLGVFGAGAKAGRVIPNKVYQALACGRGVITRHAPAYPPQLPASASAGLAFVAPGDPEALALAIRDACDTPGSLEARAAAAGEVYRAFFSEASVRSALAALLRAVVPGTAP